MADLQGDDIILCQITSQLVADNYSVPLYSSDFSEGSLKKTSNIRPNRLFTADKNIIIRTIGKIKPDVYNQVVKKLLILSNIKQFYHIIQTKYFSEIEELIK